LDADRQCFVTETAWVIVFVALAVVRRHIPVAGGAVQV
jgi:hypothetical protein